ncbi:MAG: restriction endonuclease subunit S [Prevotellaceae bacterium]|nr:restriction endonuclease subunit S [Prevotellaceae bacterium]
MRHYKAYKDSGVSWIGSIPEHWEVKRLGLYFAENTDTNKTLENTAAYKISFGELIRKQEEYREDEDAQVYSTYTILKPDDIVVNGLNLNYDLTSPRIAIAKENGVITSAYVCMHPRHATLAPYFCWLFKGMDARKMFHGMGKGIRLTLSYDELKKQHLPVPPYAEQSSIAAFLQAKSDKIEQYVAERERERELFDSLRQATIANAVTRGLNPHTPLKDSGIPWIGPIPQHWEVKKIKYLFKERSQKGYPNEPPLCATQKYGVIPQSMYENRVVVVNKGLDGLKLVKVGDFVISLRSFQGGIEYAYYQGIISAAYTVLTLVAKPNEVLPDYIKYLFKSHNFIQLLKTCVTGIREGQNINYDLLRNNSIMIPPLAEQQAIVNYIDGKIREIDSYVERIEREIVYLKELKQRLISDAVTGRINVSGINI